MSLPIHPGKTLPGKSFQLMAILARATDEPPRAVNPIALRKCSVLDHPITAPGTTFSSHVHARRPASLEKSSPICFRSLFWLLLPILLCASGHAQVIRYVDGAASGTDVGTSWPNAYRNLQSALVAASSGDQIWVSAGVYRPDVGGGQVAGNRLATFQLKTGVEVYGGFPPGGGDGTLAARNQDPPSKSTILSGDLLGNDGPGFSENSENSYHVVTGSGAGSSAVLDGFRITGANANGSSAQNHHRGGGLTCFNSGATTVNYPTVNNCVFVANSANQGGAIYIRKGSIAITQCQFTNNIGSSGGAVHGTSGSTCVLDRCDFSGNSVTGIGSGGGAIFNYQSSLTVSHCTFLNNRSGWDGGAVDNAADSTASFSECSFEGNTAIYSGGAVDNSSNVADFDDCIFEKNSASDYGGAVFGHSSSLTFRNCSLVSSSAPSGGAVAAFGASQLTMENTRLRGNQATQDSGGALYSSTSSVNLTNCELAGNLAKDGAALLAYKTSGSVTNCSIQGNRTLTAEGAIYLLVSETLAFSNSIVWNNSAMDSTVTQSASMLAYDSTPTFSHCLFENCTDSYLNAMGTANLDGTNSNNSPAFINPLDPSLAPADGGDLRLHVSSPVLDRGDNGANLKTTDLSGAQRVQNGLIDLGAYEGGYEISFAVLFPGLDPDTDANANGTSNFGDYAAGKDPFVKDDTHSAAIHGSQLKFHHRWNATDLDVAYEMSSNLQTWDPMVEGTDYVISSTTNSGSRTCVILNIPQAPVPGSGMFYRERLAIKIPAN